MHNTVKTYSPQKLNQEEIYNLNKPIKKEKEKEKESERESIIVN